MFHLSLFCVCILFRRYNDVCLLITFRVLDDTAGGVAVLRHPVGRGGYHLQNGQVCRSSFSRRLCPQSYGRVSRKASRRLICISVETRLIAIANVIRMLRRTNATKPIQAIFIPSATSHAKLKQSIKDPKKTCRQRLSLWPLSSNLDLWC